jgi:hypothetical protein
VVVRTSLVALALLGCTTEGTVLSAGGDAATGDDDAGDGADADVTVCPPAGPCPDPPAGDITVCGRVLDLEVTAPVTSSAPTVRIYDFVDLRLNPQTAVAHATVTPDACGWYHATVDGLAGIFVVHTGELGQGGIHRPPGQTVRANAWTLRAATDDTWSAAAGLTGQTFADLGSLLAIFVDVGEPPVTPLQGAPIAGVELTINGSPSAADDFYFADTAPLARSMLAPAQAATGADGSGLLRDVPSLSQFSGDHADCEFADVNTLSIAGTIQVQEIAGNCN